MVLQAICNGVPPDMADAAYIFKITPRIPVAVLYWEGDDEFPPESKILYDKSVTEHLASNTIFALAVVICAGIGRLSGDGLSLLTFIEGVVSYFTYLQGFHIRIHKKRIKPQKKRPNPLLIILFLYKIHVDRFCQSSLQNYHSVGWVKCRPQFFTATVFLGIRLVFPTEKCYI